MINIQLKYYNIQDQIMIYDRFGHPVQNINVALIYWYIKSIRGVYIFCGLRGYAFP